MPEPQGRGTEKIMVSDHKGKVVLHFDAPVEYCALEPQVASDLAEHLARTAYKAKFGDTPTTQDRSQITEQLRVRMQNRVNIMLHGYADNPPPYLIQAQQIVDAIFREVG